MRHLLAQVDSATLSATQVRGRAKASKRRVKPRKLVIQPMDTTALNNSRVIVNIVNPTGFRGKQSGALIGRVYGGNGEMIRLYNPTSGRWEMYRAHDFLSTFGELPTSLGIGSYCLLRDVSSVSTQESYDHTWSAGQVNTAMRLITV